MLWKSKAKLTELELCKSTIIVADFLKYNRED